MARRHQWDDVVDELFERLPALAALKGWERDRQKDEANQICDAMIVAVDEDEDWLMPAEASVADA